MEVTGCWKDCPLHDSEYHACNHPDVIEWVDLPRDTEDKPVPDTCPLRNASLTITL